MAPFVLGRECMSDADRCGKCRCQQAEAHGSRHECMCEHRHGLKVGKPPGYRTPEDGLAEIERRHAREGEDDGR